MSRKKTITPTESTAKVYQSRMVPLKDLRIADYNPRKLNPEQLDSICRSIVQFGFVEPLVVRDEDLLIVGGHQRVIALKHLLSGKFNLDGVAVRYELPNGEVPVMPVQGLSDQGAKMLNLALNRVGGEWDYERLPALLSELSKEVTLTDLVVTGFTASEITDYIDLLDHNAAAPGMSPTNLKHAPKITLEFSSKELRDTFKASLADMTGGSKDKPTGDLLAERLEMLKRKGN